MPVRSIDNQLHERKGIGTITQPRGRIEPRKHLGLEKLLQRHPLVRKGNRFNQWPAIPTGRKRKHTIE